MGFFKNIFGKSKQPSSSSMSLDEAINIAGDYGKVLGYTKGLVSDSKKLPYAKSYIKEALILMLRNIPDSYVQEQIKIAYISVADFQEGVGGADIAPVLPNEKASKENKEQQLEEFLFQWNRFEEWTPIVDSEQEQLISELKQLGFWNE